MSCYVSTKASRAFAVLFCLGITVPGVAQESPPGCQDAAVSVAINPIPTGIVRHGQQVCYSVCFGAQGSSSPCDIANFSASLVLPDGTVRPVTADATIPATTFFCCPSADPRCLLEAPDNCYTVSHADEITTFTDCPPVPSGNLGRVLAYTFGDGDSLTLQGDTVAPCATANNPLVHGSCCEPCEGTCTTGITCNECPGNSVFTAGGDCSISCALNCATDDACRNDGVCVPGSGRNNCATTPGGTPASCTPITSVCDIPPPGFTCDDNNVCTTDACVDDTDPNTPCCENTPIVCPQLPCQRIIGCDPALGCQYEFDCREPGKECCRGGDECHTPICSKKSGECSLIPDCRSNTDCDDHDACTADICTLDGCCEHTPIVCDDQNDCTTSFCDPQRGCVFIPQCDDATHCDDSNACTVDTCDALGCCRHEPRVCTPPPCFTLTGCDPALGCQFTSVCSTPGFCDDNNVCTSDTCSETAVGCCQHSPIACSPRPCQRITGCDPVLGCQYAFDCREPGVDCCPDTGGPCATASCDPASGACTSTPDCTVDHDCKDADLCTNDVCNSSGCCEHPAVPCDDGNSCTEDSCDPTTGCVYAPGCKVDHDCKDDNLCTEDICTDKGCCEHRPRTCNDDNSCTTDSCDPAIGCVFAPGCSNAHDCKDSDLCTDDLCNDKGCCEHRPRSCNDGNSCTIDACDPALGCIYDPACESSHDCKDNNACTVDVCTTQGCCEHPLLDCDDHNACTSDSCNPTSGCGHEPECRVDSDCGEVSKPCHQARCVEGCCVDQTGSCCGNHTIEQGETCDPPGSVHNGRTCRSDCTYCGDGIKNGSEECDDGNSNDGDACSNACKTQQMSCDDGNPCTDDLCVCDDDDDWSSAKGTTNGRTAASSARIGDSNTVHHDDDDDDDDDHGGQQCTCPPSACDDDHNVANGDHDDDPPKCVCIHRLHCTAECCGNCDDGNPCTEDYCAPGSSVGGAANGDWDDDADTCVCKHRSLCDDHNSCTVDTCTPDGCTHTPKSCDDHNECTDDTCDPHWGCFHRPECTSDWDCGSTAKPCMTSRCVDGCCVTQSSGSCCGNHHIDYGESCDPPGSVQSNGKSCRDDCTYCGDGIKNGGELCDDGNSNNNDSCNSKCEPPSQHGAEGCTPGFWKQSQHFGQWVTYDPWDWFDTVFGVHSTFAANTLLEVLMQGGGGEASLGRHAVAALLNSVNHHVDFAFDTATVIAMVRQAYATGDFETTKNLLKAENERGCPW